jgi:bifunctional DNA-binding transcriptional regulator/antitoxin component of YhaV-PrlF toxin-antitoxin module
MPIKYTVTITSVGSSSVIVLPRPILDGFNLKKGQRLEMIVRDDGIYIPLAGDKGSSVKEVSKSKGGKIA